MSDAPPNTGSLAGGIGGTLTLLGIIYTAINHKRLRMNCCGKKIEVEVDVDSTSPKVAPEPEKKPEEV